MDLLYVALLTEQVLPHWQMLLLFLAFLLFEDNTQAIKKLHFLNNHFFINMNYSPKFLL